MWLGACVSTIGTFVQQFAQSWLVYELTKDPFYLGLDLFLGQLPIILFSLVGGVFADGHIRIRRLRDRQQQRLDPGLNVPLAVGQLGQPRLELAGLGLELLPLDGVFGSADLLRKLVLLALEPIELVLGLAGLFVEH